MSDLPVSWISPAVATNAARPSSEWLMARVRTLLRHFWEARMSEAEETMMMADWLDALDHLPQEAIEMAIRGLIRSPSRHRPTPGEVRARAEAYVAKPALAKPAPQPFGPDRALTEAERERCQAMLDDLRQMLGSTPKAVVESPLANIIAIVADVCGTTVDHIKGTRGGRDRIAARFHAYRACRAHTGKSSTEIGRALGDRDHATVLQGAQKAEALMVMDPEFAAVAAEIDRRLSA